MITRLSSGSPIETVLDTVERDGGAIVEGLLQTDLLGKLNAELDAEIDTRPAGSQTGDVFMSAFHGHNTKRFCGLAARAPSFLEVLLHPAMTALADRFLLPNCGSYWVNTTQMMVIGPGEPAQLLHRDQANWPHFPWPGFELTVSCMFALSDFHHENGATLVVPRSHHWENERREPELGEIAVAEMPAGSALLYTGKVLHGAGNNRSRDEWRRGMHLSFVVGWLRPEENHYLAVPLEKARALPERARQLLGYASYHPSVFGGRLGLVDFEEAASFVGGPES
jgi:ectoine hydroxylase-related dioxygenase (phytanoyl-CoA dioxygenase family)